MLKLVFVAIAVVLTGCPDPQNGSSGSQGPIGPRGETGAVGPQGERGFTGFTGPQGSPGVQGATGTGFAGPKGDTGATGATGPQGPQGNTGFQGGRGDMGLQGPQGLQGDAGMPGPQGVQGNAGPKGDMGEGGLQGPYGAIGATGAIGPQGVQGVPGPQGVQGNAGPKGDMGPGFVWKDELEVVVGHYQTIPLGGYPLNGDGSTVAACLLSKSLGVFWPINANTGAIDDTCLRFTNYAGNHGLLDFRYFESNDCNSWTTGTYSNSQGYGYVPAALPVGIAVQTSRWHPSNVNTIGDIWVIRTRNTRVTSIVARSVLMNTGYTHQYPPNTGPRMYILQCVLIGERRVDVFPESLSQVSEQPAPFTPPFHLD